MVVDDPLFGAVVAVIKSASLRRAILACPSVPTQAALVAYQPIASTVSARDTCQDSDKIR